MLAPALEEPLEASLGGKLHTTTFLQLVGNMNYKVIFHKPLKQWLVCFPKVILLGVWAEGIYESDFSRPRERLYVLSSIFLLAPIFSSVTVFHTASGINLTVIRG